MFERIGQGKSYELIKFPDQADAEKFLDFNLSKIVT